MGTWRESGWGEGLWGDGEIIPANDLSASNYHITSFVTGWGSVTGAPQCLPRNLSGTIPPGGNFTVQMQTAQPYFLDAFAYAENSLGGIATAVNWDLQVRNGPADVFRSLQTGVLVIGTAEQILTKRRIPGSEAKFIFSVPGVNGPAVNVQLETSLRSA